MLLLTAALWFSPHYAVTQETAPSFAAPSSVVTDAQGNTYNASYEPTMPGLATGLISKLNPEGQLVYRVPASGGPDLGEITLAPDSQGNVYAAINGSVNGHPRATAIKLDPTGRLLYAFPLGVGSVRALAVGPDGSAYLAGGAYAIELQTTQGVWGPASKTQGTNAFVIKLSPRGDRIVYATYLDNVSDDYSYGTARAIAVDASGFAYVAGDTSSPAFPVTQAAFQKQCDCVPNQISSIFVLKLSPDASSLAYSTFLGPSAEIFWQIGMTVDAAGSAQILSNTLNTFRTRHVSPDGSSLLSDRSVTLGATSTANIIKAAFNDQDTFFISGSSNVLSTPVSEGAFQSGASFAAVVRWSDGAILYSTRLPYGDGNSGVISDKNGGFVTLGLSRTNNFLHQAWSLIRFVPEGRSGTATLGIANAAESALSTHIAPGEIVTIFGINLGPDTVQDASFDASGHLPFSLAGTEVSFNDIRAPIISVASQQVVAVVPFGVAGADTVEIILKRNGNSTNRMMLPVRGAEPQIVLAPGDASHAAAINEDGTINCSGHSATVGEILTIFINGAGEFIPAPEDGTEGQPGAQLVLPIAAMFWPVGGHGGQIPADIAYAGPAPGLAGITQINFRIPPAGYVFVPRIRIYIGSEWSEAGICAVTQ